MTPIEIVANGQKLTTLRLASAIGRAHVSRCHPDAKFFSSEQFRLTPSGTGWLISPVIGTVNPTLVNGLPLSSPQAVSSGMTVSVRGAKGLSLILQCLSPDPLPMAGSVTPTPPVTASLPTLTATLPPVTASLPPLTAPLPTAPTSPAPLTASSPTVTATLPPLATSPPPSIHGSGGVGNLFRSCGGTAALVGLGTLFSSLFSGLSSASSSGSYGSGRNKVREGDSSYGRVILTIDGERVRRGDSSYGDVLMRFDGAKIRQGDSSYGTVIATVDGNKVRQGDSSYGTVIATIDGNKVRQGDSSYGTVIATTEGGRMSGAAAAAFLCLM